MGHPLSSPEHARHALLYMWRIRKFEEAVEDLFGRGMMHGTMHLYTSDDVEDLIVADVSGSLSHRTKKL